MGKIVTMLKSEFCELFVMLKEKMMSVLVF